MRRLAAVALILCLAPAPTTFAGKPDKRSKPKEGAVKKEGAEGKAVFAEAERDKVRLFFTEKHGRGNCPPGLAKKNNGCLPPGLAKKRYLVGSPLPAAVVVEEIPAELSVRIGPAPAGYRYAVVDGDFVKLAVGTMLVVDAIEGLVE